MLCFDGSLKGNFEGNAGPLPVGDIITKRRGNSTERNQGRRMNAEEKRVLLATRRRINICIEF